MKATGAEVEISVPQILIILALVVAFLAVLPTFLPAQKSATDKKRFLWWIRASVTTIVLTFGAVGSFGDTVVKMSDWIVNKLSMADPTKPKSRDNGTQTITEPKGRADPTPSPSVVTTNASAPACSAFPIIEAATGFSTITLSRSDLIGCMQTTECDSAAAAVCAQAGGSTDINRCSQESLSRLSESDRRELAVQFEERGCFREALVWVAGARSADVKPWLARWKRSVCRAGRPELLEDSGTRQTLSTFGIADPSFDREIDWKLCVNP